MNRKDIKKFLHHEEDDLVPRCKYLGETQIDGLTNGTW